MSCICVRGIDVSFSQEELDDIIASECLYCGEVMIKSIADPFVKPDDVEVYSWTI